MEALNVVVALNSHFFFRQRIGDFLKLLSCQCHISGFSSCPVRNQTVHLKDKPTGTSTSALYYIRKALEGEIRWKKKGLLNTDLPATLSVVIVTWYKATQEIKGKKRRSFPVTGLRGPEGSRKLRLPDFMTLGTRRWTPLRTDRLYHSFLEAESNPDTWTSGKKSPVTRPGIDPGTFRLVATPGP